MQHRWLHTILLVAVIAAPGSLNAQTAAGVPVYKWVDEHGVTHYSESPPAKGKSELRKIEVPPATPSTAPAESNLRIQDLELQRRMQEREAQSRDELIRRQAIDAEVRRRECDRAKRELDIRERMRANRIPDPYRPGERTPSLDELRDAVSKWCN